jgi:glycosyltransferase involved in cell wall biosynthesis
LRTLLLLTSRNLDEWSANAAAVPLPGGMLPYGMHHLSSRFRLTWPTAHHQKPWRTPLPRIAGSLVRRRAPGLQGSLASCCSIPQQKAAGAALSVFEDSGLGFARWQSLSRLVPSLRTPHIMVVCWLAEDGQHMTRAQRASIRRSMRSISGIVAFSANQVPLLQDLLGVAPERVSVVPFAVDTRYYSPSETDGPAGGGGVVAVGGDSRRDYATLMDAARIAGVPVTVVCYPRNISGLDLPPQVKVLSNLSHDEYRRLLLKADLVVTPTIAPAYPSGQTVVLEAMSMGRATLTTDSPAMREYVTDGVDGVLVPPRAPAEMAHLIGDLLKDDDQRQSLGAAAAKTVHAYFKLEHMWQRIAELLRVALEDQPPGTGVSRAVTCPPGRRPRASWPG